MLLVRERVITCRVRAFTLFPEIRGGSQIIIPIMICDRKQNQWENGENSFSPC